MMKTLSLLSLLLYTCMRVELDLHQAGVDVDAVRHDRETLETFLERHAPDALRALLEAPNALLRQFYKVYGYDSMAAIEPMVMALLTPYIMDRAPLPLPEALADEAFVQQLSSEDRDAYGHLIENRQK